MYEYILSESIGQRQQKVAGSKLFFLFLFSLFLYLSSLSPLFLPLSLPFASFFLSSFLSLLFSLPLIMFVSLVVLSQTPWAWFGELWEERGPWNGTREGSWEGGGEGGREGGGKGSWEGGGEGGGEESREGPRHKAQARAGEGREAREGGLELV
jgi:hypothetical protein